MTTNPNPNPYYDRRTTTTLSAPTTRDIQLALNDMTTRDEVLFGKVRVILHVGQMRVRYECLYENERKNFAYSLREPDIWWRTRNPIADHQECIEQVIEFIQARLPVDEAVSR